MGGNVPQHQAVTPLLPAGCPFPSPHHELAIPPASGFPDCPGGEDIVTVFSLFLLEDVFVERILGFLARNWSLTLLTRTN